MLLLLLALEIAGHPAQAAASSALGKRYLARNAFDGDPATAWVEGAKGLGEGETLTLAFDQPVQVAGFVLVAGYARSIETFVQNAAPSRVVISADGAQLLDLRIPFVESRPEGGHRCLREAVPLNLAPRIVVLSKPVTARKLELRLAEVSAGTKFDDTAISEWRPLLDADLPLPLRGLRDGSPPLASDAKADALQPWPAQGEFPDYGGFLAQRLGGATLPPAQAFLAAFGPEFLDHAVLEDGPRLLGAMSFSHGDGEWDELYPELVLDPQGRIAELHRLFHSDAAPGCRHALPPKL